MVRVRMLLAGLVATVMGCASAPSHGPPPLTSWSRVEPGLDLSAKNYPPDREIKELLRGDPASGALAGAVRVAVPPFKVLGQPDKQWVGEGAAALVSAALGNVPGVSVLERGELALLIDELKKGALDEGSGDQVSKLGKVLGANYVTVGKLIPADQDKFKATVAIVRVETGERLPAVVFDMKEDDLESATSPAVKDLLGKLDRKADLPAPAKPLGGDRLRLASLAREAHYGGDLAKAQPLYAKAMPAPTASFGLEADYVTLMKDVALHEWVRDRVDRILSTMPEGPGTLCVRARLIAAKHAEESSVEEARQTVRAAASCGDPSVVAQALISYARTMDEIHTPSRLRAVQLAEETLQGVDNAYVRCQLGLESVNSAVDTGARARDPRPYEALAKQCREAGNLRVAAIAAQNAANMETRPSRKIALQREAVELATPVGGLTLDLRLIRMAQLLRDAGRPSEADEVLLRAMKARLEPIVTLAGGLPDPEARLDRDLLNRIGLSRFERPSAPPGEADALLVRAHRKGLARVLREWAARTRPESKSQADVYDGVVEALDPASPDNHGDAEGEALYVKRLAAAKLTLEQIEKADQPPLWGTNAKPAQAGSALWDWFWNLRGKGEDTIDQRRRIVGAVRKVAGWLQDPRWEMNALRLEALQQGDEGHPARAVSILESAKRVATKRDDWMKLVIENLVDVLEEKDKREALEARRQSIAVRQKLAPNELIWGTWNLGYRAIGLDHETAQQSFNSLVEIADKLEKEKEWKDAAYALERAGALHRQMNHANGTPVSVRLMARRVEVLDRLDDPLLGLVGRADAVDAVASLFWHTYRAGAPKLIAEEPAVRNLVRELRGKAEGLAEEGRYRDAARIVTELPNEAPGMKELVSDALSWAERFEDSAEYPSLAATLWSKRFAVVDDAQQKREAQKKATELYLQAGNRAAAVEQINNMKHLRSQDDVFGQLDQCLVLAGDTEAYRGDCVNGVAQWAALRRFEPDASRFRRAARIATQALAAVDADSTPQWRYTYRGHVAILAARGDDLETVRRMNREVKTYYTETSPNAYMWVTHLSRVADALKQKHPAFAVELYREFDRANGASAYWASGVYFRYAQVAKRAGDAEAEAFFLERGRKLAERYPAHVHYYNMYPVGDAIDGKRWSEVSDLYEAAERDIEKRFPRHKALPRKLRIDRAAVEAMRGRNRAAYGVLEGDVTEITNRLEAGRTSPDPCLDARLLEVAASVQLARSQCKQGEALREAAEKMRRSCKQTECRDVPGGGKEWCDEASFAEWRASNACSRKFSGDASMLSRW